MNVAEEDVLVVTTSVVWWC